MRWTAALLLLLVACNPPHPEASGNNRTSADRCFSIKLHKLSSIDHEQPSEGALGVLIAFCKGEYP